MINTTLAPFNNLTPVRLTYLELSSCDILSTKITHSNQLTTTKYPLLTNVEDVNLNNKTGLVLTSKQKINDVFIDTSDSAVQGTHPVDTTLRPDFYNNNFLVVYEEGNTIRCGANPRESDIFKIQASEKIPGGVNILCNNNYLYVIDTYPFKVALCDVSQLKLKSANVYTFFIKEITGGITISVETSSGTRFLTVGSDGILRATGVYLNDSQLDVYRFILSSLLDVPLQTLNNKWVTYYMNNSNKTHNSDVVVRRSLETSLNYIVNFSLSDIFKKNTANINILNLKNNFNTTGVGTNINNITTESNISTDVTIQTLSSVDNEGSVSVNTADGIVIFTYNDTILL
jgi:hypothetical protein